MNSNTWLLFQRGANSFLLEQRSKEAAAGLSDRRVSSQQSEIAVTRYRCTCDNASGEQRPDRDVLHGEAGESVALFHLAQRSLWE